MAIRKPLFLDDDGYLKEVSDGDTLIGSNAAASFTANNANAGTVAKGAPVYITASGEVDLARANADGTRRVAGIATASAATATPVNVQVDGIISLDTGEWDALTGDTGGLDPGDDYILSPDAAGELVKRNSTIDSGEWMEPVLRAINTTDAIVLVNEHGVKRS